MIIDAHHHLWDPRQRDYPWLAGADLTPIRRPYRPSDLRAHASAAGVEGTVLVQTVGELAETSEFLAIADANRDLVRGVVGWAELTGPGLAATLATLRAGTGGDLLVGIRHQVQDEADPDWLARPDVVRGLRTVASAGLTYDLLVLPHQLEAAIAAVQQVPTGRFVLDHAGKPPIASGETAPWGAQLARLAAQDTVACKLSGLVTEANWTQWTVADLRPFVETVFTAFGPDRVLFGSDWPVCELAANYAQVFELAGELCAELSSTDRAAVFGVNAAGWYRLGLT